MLLEVGNKAFGFNPDKGVIEGIITNVTQESNEHENGTVSIKSTEYCIRYFKKDKGDIKFVWETNFIVVADSYENLQLAIKNYGNELYRKCTPPKKDEWVWA